MDIRIFTKILSMPSKLANSCLCVGIYLCISRTSAMFPIVGPYSTIPVLHTLYNIYLQLSESVLFSNTLWKNLQSKQVTANVRLDDNLSAGMDFDYSQF